MHLFKKTVGFIALLSAIPAAYAATARGTIATDSARVSMTTASRMPKLVTAGSSVSTSSATGATTTAAALMANSECIDAYRECISGADACGENFEECTNKILFHAQMPKCLSTLAQCSASGVESLFGTSVVSALSNVAAKNTYGEITDYTYPTDGSVLGQMITAASIANRYDTSTCVRRYTSCLKKDTVCGNDFELCTTDKEFRKQRVFCDSTLARCSGDGVKELLGSSTLTAAPSKTSRVGEMINEGAALAAVNAVSTCYKVVDQCILGACAENPYKCYENSDQSVVDIVDAINNGTPLTTELVTTMVNKSSIAAYIKNACFETVGASKYCYATFIGNGQMPTNAQLRDEGNQEDVYAEAYASRMNAGMKTKIAELVDKFDAQAKNKCTETIKSCAMRVCGGGSGAACYSLVYGGADKSINGTATYDEIKLGCAAIVNTDTNCMYAVANPSATGPYTYNYINKDAFDTLFPAYNGGNENDVIGVVASLNSALATNYNDAALAQMKKQCQSVATSCVKSMCGNDYVNCYRNRTDIWSDLGRATASSTYGTGDTAGEIYNRSMLKVNGVLDRTIVLGLCLDTVKNASACEEHLAIETAKLKLKGNTNTSESWGDATSVRDSWITSRYEIVNNDVTSYPQRVVTDAYGNNLFMTENGDEVLSGNGNSAQLVYSPDNYVYAGAQTLFNDLLYDIEREAQAKYNAKLTKEQNMCMSSNNGGIMGKNDMSSTFMWVKLKGDRVPSDYTVNGLKQTAFTASNDLYGSFCRVRITLQSDDKKIQEYMKNKSWTTAYFATGDSFTCGSWIPESDLKRIAQDVADDKTENMRKSQDRTAFWTTTLGVLGGGVGGYFLGEGITNGNVMKGLTNLDEKNKKTTIGEAAQECVAAVDGFNATDSASITTRKAYVQEAIRQAKEAGVNTNVAETAAENYTCVLDNQGRSSACKKDNGKEVLANSSSEAPMLSAMNALKNRCEQLTSKTSENDHVQKKTGWITPTTTAVTALASGLLMYKATRDIQRSNLDAEEKAAIEEFMNNVGRHITCYIGGDEAGSYGDIITTSLE